MAESATSLKGLRAQMAAAAQAQAEERRSLSGNSPGPTPPSTTAKPQGPKPVIDGAVIRIDEKLRVAKERREEADRQQALRDNQIVERERKAKLQVERQMEERQKKLDEQRRKEEQKRSAVEEKRKLKAEEEKEHYEAVMRRTLERSQRVEQRQKRWSWGGLSTDSDGRAGDSDASVSSPVAIEITPASPQKPPRKKQVDKRSTSTMNLKQSGDAAISKRLSTSSATLIKTPDKSAKRRSASCQRLPSNGIAPQAKEDGKKPQVEKPGRSVLKRSSSLSRGGGVRAQTPPAKPDKGATDDQARRAQQACVADGGVLSRLLTPTQASLARSKSAAALSADGADAAASASPLQPPPRGPLRSRSIDRQKSGMTGSVSADGALDPSLKDRRLTSPISQRPPSPSNSLGRNRSPSPAPPPAPKRTPSPAPKRAPSPAPKRTPSPAAAKQGSRSRPPSPGAGKQRPPSPQPNAAAPASKPPPIQKPALTPTGPQTLRKRDSKSKDLLPGQPVHPPSPDAGQASAASPSPSPAPPAPHSKSKDKDDPKAMVGTSSKEEAAKMLAENRRLAREQKEKDELLRVQREEEERLRKEEEQRLAEVARLEREEQQKRQAEEKAQRDEEEALLAEEDRVRLAAEEALRQEELQREREEAEARALEEAERVRVERERVLQQNQQERMERKKRIEEIMKRTRKGEDSDKRDGDDDDKDDQDDGEDDVDDIDCEAKEDDMVHHEDADGEADGEADAAKEEECCVAAGEPVSERQTPVGSVNGQSDTDDKENNNDMSTDGTQAVSPIPKSRLVEGSEFLNEEDASKAGLVPGVNGKPGPWSFEELIDLNVHSKSRPLLQSEDRNQGLIDCDGASDGPPRGAFEDNGAPGVKSMHSSPQPLEALAEV
ncbi:ensconsin isoform X2 [Gadus macrocephalus]|uniref:ensconsin isoform X2 n=1 Tax=Gadus macrocephalus TaxID=80720 RepID=UPI0028CB3F0E|nr:ensconsin isoform X2 [Gadus macrocephalus]